MNADYCFWATELGKQADQTIGFQLMLKNYTKDYSLYLWYSNDRNDSFNNIVGTF